MIKQLDNPFEIDTLFNSSGFVPEWDVPSANDHITQWFDSEIRARRLGSVIESAEFKKLASEWDSLPKTERDRALNELTKDKSLGQREVIENHFSNLTNQIGKKQRKIGVILGTPGFGKTHLLGRVNFLLHDQIHFVYVSEFTDLKRVMSHVRWKIVESFFDGPVNQPSPLKKLFAKLLQPSFQGYFDWLPGEALEKHQKMQQRMEEDPLTVLEVLKPVADLHGYHRLADSIAVKLPQLPQDIVRAFVLGLSSAAQDVRRWLRGEILAEDRLAELRLPQESPTVSQILKTAACLLEKISPAIPIVVCFDQMEHVLKSAELLADLTAGWMDWIHEIPNIVLALGCLEDTWKTIPPQFSSLQARANTLLLQPLSPDQTVELVRRRMRSWTKFDAAKELHPFAEQKIKVLAEKKQINPRIFVQQLKKADRHAFWGALR